MLELVVNIIFKVTHSCLYSCPLQNLLPRVNVTADTPIKTQSRHLIELCIGAHLSILNGRHKDDSPRAAIHQEAQV